MTSRERIGNTWLIYGKLWMEYCSECKKRTRHRYLECEEHGKECDVVVCCECGMESVDGEEVVCQVK